MAENVLSVEETERWFPVSGWGVRGLPGDPCKWVDRATGEPATRFQALALGISPDAQPPGGGHAATWSSAWVGGQDWEYAFDFKYPFHPAPAASTDCVRRRLWQRSYTGGRSVCAGGGVRTVTDVPCIDAEHAPTPESEPEPELDQGRARGRGQEQGSLQDDVDEGLPSYNSLFVLIDPPSTSTDSSRGSAVGLQHHHPQELAPGFDLPLLDLDLDPEQQYPKQRSSLPPSRSRSSGGNAAASAALAAASDANIPPPRSNPTQLLAPQHQSQQPHPHPSGGGDGAPLSPPAPAP
eukprot:gene19419-32112_t